MLDCVNPFGVHLFFLLSAFLIVSLLLRERQKTGTVNVPFFAVRRALRIWPLYFLVLGFAFAMGRLDPSIHMETMRLAAFTFLAGNIYIAHHGWGSSPSIVLWSISVHEQFYLVVPALARFGGQRSLRVGCWLALASAYVALVLLSLSGAASGSTVWVNSFVSFQFFAAGGLIAIHMQGRTNRLHPVHRAGLLGVGLLLFAVAARWARLPYGVPATLAHTGPGYLMLLVGCVAIFFSVLDLPAKQRSVPGYLGLISYGLYEFHIWFLYAFDHLFQQVARLGFHSNLLLDTIALACTVALAALSYHFFELPFLRLKSRLEIVRSRPQGNPDPAAIGTAEASAG